VLGDVWELLRKRSGFFVLWVKNMMKKNICTALKKVVVIDVTVHSIQVIRQSHWRICIIQYRVHGINR
jgi:hypothetical protein